MNIVTSFASPMAPSCGSFWLRVAESAPPEIDDETWLAIIPSEI